MTEEEKKEKARERHRRWREANREKLREYQRQYRKNNLEQLRETARNSYHRNREDNLDRNRESCRRWRRANPEKAREAARNWKEANPGKARVYKHCRRARRRDQHGMLPVTAEVITERFEVFGHRCAYCGAEHELQADHFIPLALGGTHAPTNLVPACPSCNHSKSDADPEEWYRAQPFFDEKRWKQIQKATGHNKAPGQLSLI